MTFKIDYFFAGAGGLDFGFEQAGFDIVYSNSFDHAYDPTKAILAWKDQLTTDGVLVIELMTGVENISRPVDPLEIS